MSHGLEGLSPQSHPSKDNVVSFGRAGIEEPDTYSFAIRAKLAGFTSGVLQDGSEQWFQSFLAQLRPGECLSLRVAFDESGGLSFGATARAPQQAVAARAYELEQALREVVASAAPGFKLATHNAVRSPDLPWRIELRPAGQRVCLDELTGRRPRPVAGSRIRPCREAPLALHLSLAPERRPDLAAVADLMRRPALHSAVLDLDLSSFRLDARQRRALQDFLKGLLSYVSRGGAHDAPLVLLHDNVLRQLKGWTTAGCGLRLAARIAAPARLPAAVLHMLCQALFGATGAQKSVTRRKST